MHRTLYMSLDYGSCTDTFNGLFLVLASAFLSDDHKRTKIERRRRDRATQKQQVSYDHAANRPAKLFPPHITTIYTRTESLDLDLIVYNRLYECPAVCYQF